MADSYKQPKLICAVSKELGIDYTVDRRAATRSYIEKTEKDTRLSYEQLKNTFYSLNEARTTKKDQKPTPSRLATIKNPLKLSAHVRKSLYSLSNEEKRKLRYATFEKVHQLWKQYVTKVLSDRDPMNIFRMDLHGCKLKCVASKYPTLIGIEGIVVQETRNTFMIIRPTNRLSTLPKLESLFEFSDGNNVYKIHGCNLLFTTQTRSKVKYKQNKCLLDI